MLHFIIFIIFCFCGNELTAQKTSESAAGSTKGSTKGSTAGTAAGSTTTSKMNGTTIPSTATTATNKATAMNATTAANTTTTTTTTTTTKASTVPPVSKMACGKFPRDIDARGSCCLLPYEFHIDAQRECFTKPGSLPIEDCYLKATKLVVDGKLDKDVAKQIYLENSKEQSKHFGLNPWVALIDDALKQCEYGTSTNKAANRITFYNCTHEKLIEKCPSTAVDTSEDCSYVADFYENCAKGGNEYCKEWPQRFFMPEFCCIVPELITNTTVEACKTECLAKTAHREKAKCRYECAYKKIDVKVGGKYDLNKLKKVLADNSNSKAKWQTSVDKAVDLCKETITAVELSESEVQVNNVVKKCLQETLSDNCKDFKMDRTCMTIQKFMEKCPLVKPLRAKIVISIPGASTNGGAKTDTPKVTTVAGKETTKATSAAGSASSLKASTIAGKDTSAAMTGAGSGTTTSLKPTTVAATTSSKTPTRATLETHVGTTTLSHKTTIGHVGTATTDNSVDVETTDNDEGGKTDGTEDE